MGQRRTIEDILLDLGAVQLRQHPPFRWASGRLAPIYCDNRLVWSDVAARNEVKIMLSEALGQSFPYCSLIAGTATAGIAPAALVADFLQLPMVYVRGEAKEHGRKNRVEGQLKHGQQAVVIEDLISTGGSSLTAVEALRERGITVLGVAALFNYEFPTTSKTFEDHELALMALGGYSSLCQKALSRGTIATTELQSLQEWRMDPRQWSSDREPTEPQSPSAH
jgi:orotate phosphoribosyltransferase